jgi:hypothetical protein
MARRPPPKKKAGQAKKPRRFDGEFRDTATQAKAWGLTEKCLRSQVARGLIPYRRLGGRIIFVASEMTAFLNCLPGVDAQTALANLAARAGEGPVR